MAIYAIQEIPLLLLLFKLCVSSGSHVVYTTQAFYLPISRTLFDPFSNGGDLEYRFSLLNLPDLPRWMFYRHANSSDQAYLYGAPEEAGDVNVEVIAMNKENYDTSRRIINFNVQPRGKRAHYQVELKLLNLNVEDMFEGNRLQQVEDIFKDHLWRTSHNVYITMVASSVDVGGRLPLNPKDKEGVVIRVGGTDNYTQDLMDLEREVLPLRKRFPCPKDYRRTAAEHLFRRRDFISDWCSFRLVGKTRSYHEDRAAASGEGSSPVLLKMNYFQLPSSRLPRRDFLLDFLVSIVVPMAVVMLLLISLTCLMCCHREGLAKRNKETPTVQLNHYSSIQRASHPLRHLVGPTKADSSPSPSLPRSRTGSPVSTLPKAAPASLPESRMSTLRSVGGPLPPAYTGTATGTRSLSRRDPLALT